MRFADRHNGPCESQVNEMLSAIGLKDLDGLIAQTVPADILLKEPLALDKAVSEHEYIGRLKNIARKKRAFQVNDRVRILRDRDSCCHNEEHTRKPELVHIIYPISG